MFVQVTSSTHECKSCTNVMIWADPFYRVHYELSKGLLGRESCV